MNRHPSKQSQTPPHQSSALAANLLETAVERVTIDPRQETLRLVVREYAGILNVLDRLLLEINHPYRNWRLILPELRGFVLKNASRFVNHEQGPECFSLFFDLFQQAWSVPGRDGPSSAALEGVTAVLDKWTSQLQPWLLHRYMPVYNRIFSVLSQLPPTHLLHLSQSRHPLKRTLSQVLAKWTKSGEENGLDPQSVKALFVQSLRVTYRHWLEQTDPIVYACPHGEEAFEVISHGTLGASLQVVEEIAEVAAPGIGELTRLSQLPSFLDIVRGYRLAAERLGQQTNGEGSAAQWRELESRKLRFMFHIMETDGLVLIHEETLREINRSLVHLVQLKQGFEEIEAFLLRTFEFLNANVVKYPHTALQCIEVLGREVFDRNNSLLVEAFLGQVVGFGFQYRLVKGVGEDWQPICNPAHLYNIRVWLNLITLNPKWCSTLISALIINLRLSGTLIRDTDLFQKEVTRLLNSNHQPVYNLVKQFTRILPVYFNEIGAEGELRDVSTELDEIWKRHDRVIHFLRKQCHVESTNLIVEMVRAILHYWRTGETRGLTPFLVESVLKEARGEGPCFDDVHRVMVRLFEVAGIKQEETLLNTPLAEIEGWIMSQEEVPETERRRVFLLIRLYQLLNLKYNLGHHGILEHLRWVKGQGFAGLSSLIKSLERGDSGYSLLRALLKALEALKEIIHSDEVFPAREEIYQKRHIAVDIPSVYGRYQEKKFDALSLTFRLENLARVQLEGLVTKIPDGFITQAAFYKVAKYLGIFMRALALDGIASRRLRNLQAVLERSLELNQFSYHQYVDIFRGFSQGVKNIISTYYVSHHRDNLARIVPGFTEETLLPKYQAMWDGEDGNASLERISETFMRDLIAETLGLQPFDNFITRIFQTLSQQEEGQLPARLLDQLMTYDPAKLFCSLQQPDKRTRNVIHLGYKGYNLEQLLAFGAPVPAGVVVTTEYFRCQEVIRTHEPAKADFLEQMRENVAHIEEQTGLAFGVAENPLLLSVRSGALISMPGMMQTIHNVGINEEIVKGLIKQSGHSFFAWDNYRRFIQSWSMAYSVGRSTFSDLMWAAKRRYGVKKKRHFTSEQMEELAITYKKKALSVGIPIPEDPWEQLDLAIERVADSWNALKAKEYRKIMNISNDWGTAVVLQRMVYGNIHGAAGSGVLFTAHPHRKLDRVVLWGDYTAGNQGEDIVGGLVSTNPISLEQCQYDKRDPDTALERCFPEVYQALLKYAQLLVYDLGWTPQEIEFTYDGPQSDNLFILQSRDMVTGGMDQHEGGVFQDSEELDQNRLAKGIGVSGGALCGRAVFNLEQIERARVEFGADLLILIRYDTVPDDIREISMAEGLLTARGGQTSHAAIVAARLNRTCVVGCEAMTVRENPGRCEVNGQVIHYGDPISIEGHHGQLYKGWHPLATQRWVPAAGIASDAG
ncbi:MAG: phosphoenolpyruvate synthase [Magnetococcales bacterium]|nr:phosphoenolpyruvate synthase [Magnetococcales bacterium]